MFPIYIYILYIYNIPRVRAVGSETRHSAIDPVPGIMLNSRKKQPPFAVEAPLPASDREQNKSGHARNPAQDPHAVGHEFSF